MPVSGTFAGEWDVCREPNPQGTPQGPQGTPTKDPKERRPTTEEIWPPKEQRKMGPTDNPLATRKGILETEKP